MPLPPLADRVLHHLLRSCTGIFSEYATIHEDEIAHALGVTEVAVSEQLIELSRRHILQFIPRKFIPYVTFTQRRVEREEIVLPPNVYADRKRELTKRVQTMVDYLQTDECRSRFFLRYFGEETQSICGQCDNCTHTGAMPTLHEAEVRRRILDFVDRHHPTSVLQIQLPEVPATLLGKVLHQMFEEEEIALGDNS